MRAQIAAFDRSFWNLMLLLSGKLWFLAQRLAKALASHGVAATHLHCAPATISGFSKD
jgi:hypothetical protein